MTEELLAVQLPFLLVIVIPIVLALAVAARSVPHVFFVMFVMLVMFVMHVILVPLPCTTVAAAAGRG